MATSLVDNGRAAKLNRCAPGWSWTSEDGIVATRDSSQRFGELSSRFELTGEEGCRRLSLNEIRSVGARRRLRKSNPDRSETGPAIGVLRIWLEPAGAL